MVDRHAPSKPQAIVVKRGRVASRLDRTRHCVLCGAALRGDHELGDMACDCHRLPSCDPRQLARLDNLVLSHLALAWPYPVNLYRTLGFDSRNDHHRDALRECVARWRRRGVCIKGHRAVGYRVGE